MDRDKISDLMDQRVEKQAHFLDNTHAILKYEEIPSSFFLLAKTASFYVKNIFRILFLSNLYFILIFATFFSLLSHFQNVFITSFGTLLVLLLYLCTLINLVLEEEDSIIVATKYALSNLIPAVYTCFIFLLVIVGFVSLAFIPQFIILTFFANSYLMKLSGGVVFAIILLPFLVWYSLFLFVVIDESQYGFSSFFRSKAYVDINFSDYIRRLVACVVCVPAIFTLTILITQGFGNLVGLFSDFDFAYDLPESFYDFQYFLEDKLIARQIDIDNLYAVLGSWFVKVVFVIPFIIIYLGFLYSTLNCKKPLSNDFSGSLLQKVILKFLLALGVLILLVLIAKFR